MKYKDIAAKYDVSVSAVKSWKSRYWKDKKLQPKKPKVATKKVAKKIAKKIVENDELDDQQQKFCVYFVKYHNATKAYQLAYGAKYTSAMVMACNLRKEPKIQEEIKRLKEIMYQDILLDPQDIVQRYIEIAFLDESEMDGKAVKMSDSLKALEWLDEHLKDKNEQNNIGNDGFLEALNASAKEDWEDEED
nr:MAG TPA: Terminase small subunit [Bacteriophage sp.]